jgi:hypothetical protein
MRAHSAPVVRAALLMPLAHPCLAGAIRAHAPGRGARQKVQVDRRRAAAGARALAAPVARSGL